MSRYTKEIDDHIYVCYGYDHPLQGYFIQVYDRRHEWKESNTEEQNIAAEEVDPSGCGEIDSYATNGMLLAKHVVGRGKIVEVLEKYDISKEHLTNIALDQPI